MHVFSYFNHFPIHYVVRRVKNIFDKVDCAQEALIIVATEITDHYLYSQSSPINFR